MHDEGPAPFLKWAGGKRQLLPRILRLAPPRIETYYEPFIGGGALFFALAAQRRFARAVLGDANPELVGCYQTVRDDVAGVIRELQKHRNTERDYYRVRQRDPRRLSAAARAARIIYLNRCGYNGLYRVNSDGRFNVPFGRYARPKICDVARLEAASRALQGAQIVCGDFREVLDAGRPGPDDFVYLDPPYVPISRTASFTAYARRAFGPADQQRLADVLGALSRQRVPAVLSNSYCATTLRLYEGLRHQKIPARRAINSVGGARGPVPEILVRTAAISIE